MTNWSFCFWSSVNHGRMRSNLSGKSTSHIKQLHFSERITQLPSPNTPTTNVSPALLQSTPTNHVSVRSHSDARSSQVHIKGFAHDWWNGCCAKWKTKLNKYLPMRNDMFYEISTMENEILNEIPTNEQWNNQQNTCLGKWNTEWNTYQWAMK